MLPRFVTLVVRKVCDVLKAVTLVGGVTFLHPRLRRLWWCGVCPPQIDICDVCECDNPGLSQDYHSLHHCMFGSKLKLNLIQVLTVFRCGWVILIELTNIIVKSMGWVNSC